jgi:hypothetical protein
MLSSVLRSERAVQVNVAIRAESEQSVFISYRRPPL